MLVIWKKEKKSILNTTGNLDSFNITNSSMYSNIWDLRKKCKQVSMKCFHIWLHVSNQYINISIYSNISGKSKQMSTKYFHIWLHISNLCISMYSNTVIHFEQEEMWTSVNKVFLYLASFLSEIPNVWIHWLISGEY